MLHHFVTDLHYTVSIRANHKLLNQVYTHRNPQLNRLIARILTNSSQVIVIAPFGLDKLDKYVTQDEITNSSKLADDVFIRRIKVPNNLALGSTNTGVGAADDCHKTLIKLLGVDRTSQHCDCTGSVLGYTDGYV